MHQILYDALKSAAQKRAVRTYGEIAPLARLDMANPAHRAEMRNLLNEISVFEHEEGRPLLSVVVVHQDDGFPGEGFFVLARELGLYDGRDKVAFFSLELRRVHDTWAAGTLRSPAAQHGGRA